jgi:hypothetical protein
MLGFPEVNISMVESSAEDLQTSLRSMRRCHLYFLHHQWLSSFPCYRNYNTINYKKEKSKYINISSHI